MITSSVDHPRLEMGVTEHGDGTVLIRTGIFGEGMKSITLTPEQAQFLARELEHLA